MPSQSAECVKCAKRRTIHRTGLCEICRSNLPEYKNRKKQYENSNKGKQRRSMCTTRKRIKTSSSSGEELSPVSSPISTLTPLVSIGKSEAATVYLPQLQALPQPAQFRSHIQAEKTSYPDHVYSAHSHVLQYLRTLGMIGARDTPSLVQLKQFLLKLLSIRPYNDIVLGNTLSEILDAYLIFITKCHIHDLELSKMYHSVPISQTSNVNNSTSTLVQSFTFPGSVGGPLTPGEGIRGHDLMELAASCEVERSSGQDEGSGVENMLNRGAVMPTKFVAASS